MWKKNRPRTDIKPGWPENELPGPWNLNSVELFLNRPLCVETPDGKCLFLFSKCHEDAVTLPERGSWDVVVGRDQMQMPGRHFCLYAIRMLKKKERKKQNDAKLFGFPYWESGPKSPHVYPAIQATLIWCWIIVFHRKYSILVGNQLKFEGWKTKSA